VTRPARALLPLSLRERVGVRAPLAATLVLALSCSPASPPLDASTLDAPSPPRVTLSIEAPDFAFVAQSTCFHALHDGGADAIVSVVWADGTHEDLAPGVTDACHTYAIPGPLVMGMSVDARGMHAEATHLVQVVFEPALRRPTQSSSIAYDAALDRVWAVEPDADTVTIVDAVSRTLALRVAVGDRPRTVAIAGDVAIVACQGDGTVHLLGTRDASHRTVALGAGAGPYGVVADPRGSVAWATLGASGELVEIDLAAATVVARLDVGRDPRGLAMRDDGTITITRWRSTQESASVAIVDAHDAASPVLVGDVLLPREVGLDSDMDNDGVLSFVSAIAPAPDGGRIIVAGLKANTVAGTYRSDHPLTSQTTARAALAEILLSSTGALGTDSFRHPFDDLDSVSALVFSPMGERLFVAMPGAEAVIVVDAFSFDSAGSIDETGHAVDGLALDPSGTTLFVHASLSRAVRIYDVSDLSRNPEPLAEISTVDAEPFAPDVLLGAQIFHRSRDPRMSRTSYLACASCHLDGQGDNLVWDFTQRGEGLRNTIPLAGRGGTAHGPIHWSANFDEIQDFEHDIRNGQGGTGFLADDVFHTGTRDTTLGDPKAGLSPELDALAAYVGSLSSFGTSPFRRDGDAPWEASVARGELLFASSGCASCHAGTRFTDSAFDASHVPLLHDVGTIGAGSGQRLAGPLTGLDTPTLRGLWSSAPYLHDGSAATLREVLRDRNPTDQHGVTTTLSDAELDDLETFLLSLDDHVP
jgi:cytochrome c peroxidase